MTDVPCLRPSAPSEAELLELIRIVEEGRTGLQRDQNWAEAHDALLVWMRRPAFNLFGRIFPRLRGRVSARELDGDLAAFIISGRLGRYLVYRDSKLQQQQEPISLTQFVFGGRRTVLASWFRQWALKGFYGSAEAEGRRAEESIKRTLHRMRTSELLVCYTRVAVENGIERWERFDSETREQPIRYSEVRVLLARDAEAQPISLVGPEEIARERRLGEIVKRGTLIVGASGGRPSWSQWVTRILQTVDPPFPLFLTTFLSLAHSSVGAVQLKDDQSSSLDDVNDFCEDDKDW